MARQEIEDRPAQIGAAVQVGAGVADEVRDGGSGLRIDLGAADVADIAVPLGLAPAVRPAAVEDPDLLSVQRKARPPADAAWPVT